MKLIFATNNLHKLREVQEVVPQEYDIISLKSIHLDGNIQETESTLEGNALLKARTIHGQTGKNVFADDTGLEVTALNMEPGVYSARYAGEEGNSEKNMDKLLLNLAGSNDRSARFRTVIALIIDDVEHLFEGIVNGRIANERSGSEGFGYDPIFIPDGYEITFAEMSSEDKNAISHRGRAVRAMAEFLKDRLRTV